MKRKLITVLIVCSTFYNCVDTNSQFHERYDIISMMIDELAYPLPPPPPPPRDIDTVVTMDESLIDSLNNINISVVLHPKLDIINILEVKDIPKQYQDLLEERIVIEEIDIKKLSSKKGHRIRLIDSLFLENRKKYKKTDLLFQFSNIYMSSDHTKALLAVTLSSSNLAGTYTIYGLKKVEGHWEIDYSKLLEES